MKKLLSTFESHRILVELFLPGIDNFFQKYMLQFIVQLFAADSNRLLPFEVPENAKVI